MDLQRVLTAVLRRANLLLIAAVAAYLAATTAAVLRDDVYEARALVDVNRLLGDEDAFSNSERADRTVANELVIAEDPALAQLASERLGGADVEALREDVSVEQLTGTDNISFTARAGEAEAAATTATQYAAAYAEARLGQRRAALTEEADEAARELAVLQEQISALSTDEEELPQGAARREVLEAQYAALVDEELSLRRQSGLDQAPEQFVLPAPAPESPAGPGPFVWGLLAAAMTLALGALAVALAHRSRDPVEHRSDVEAAGLPVLAEEPPAVNPWRRAPDPARAVEAAAVALAARTPVPAVVCVLSVEGREHGDLASALADGLRDEEAPPVEVVGASAAAAGARGLLLVRRSDLVLVVVVRGVTRRADLVRTLEQVGQLSAAPRLALLVDRSRARRAARQPAPSTAPVEGRLA